MVKNKRVEYRFFGLITWDKRPSDAEVGFMLLTGILFFWVFIPLWIVQRLLEELGKSRLGVTKKVVFLKRHGAKTVKLPEPVATITPIKPKRAYRKRRQNKPKNAPVPAEKPAEKKEKPDSVAVEDKPKPVPAKPAKRKYQWSQAAKSRSSWIGKRAAELRSQGLSRSDAMRAATNDWKTFHDSETKKDEPPKAIKRPYHRRSVPGSPYKRKGEDARVASHNDKMQEWNGKGSDETQKPIVPEGERLVCGVCNKNPVIHEGDLCPECEAAFAQPGGQ